MKLVLYLVDVIVNVTFICYVKVTYYCYTYRRNNKLKISSTPN